MKQKIVEVLESLCFHGPSQGHCFLIKQWAITTYKLLHIK